MPAVRRAATAAFALLIACQPTPEERLRTGALGEPIINGSPATIQELYGTVALADKNGQFCTGTLIAPTVVVTAAHCVITLDKNNNIVGTLAPGDASVIAGTLDADAAKPEHTFAIATVVPHAGYPGKVSADPEGLGRDEDIALLLLASPVKALTPVALLAADQIDVKLKKGVALVISGYGTRDTQGKLSGQLYIAETPYQRRSDYELVAGATAKPDTCPGDSGGPAYLMLDGGPVLVGATSRGTTTAVNVCGDGGIYTLVPPYEPWLKESSKGAYPPPMMGGTGGAGGSGGAAETAGVGVGGADGSVASVGSGAAAAPEDGTKRGCAMSSSPREGGLGGWLGLALCALALGRSRCLPVNGEKLSRPRLSGVSRR